MLSDSEHNYNQILNAIDMIGHAPPPLFFSQPSFVPSHDVVTICPIDSDQPTPLFFSPPPFAPSNDVVTICPIHNEQTTPMSGPEFQPSKKPRNEETPLISIPNPNPSTNSGNSGTGGIFFKTRLCGKFKLGTCPYGTNCNFAHGVEDLRKPPSNWYEFVGPNRDERVGNREDDHRIISKLKLCRRFYKGEQCPYGERCHFLHEVPPKSREDPERFRESTAISLGTTGSPWQNGNVSDKPDGNGIMNSTVDSNLMNQKPWKTRMCNKWETMGYCPFGDKCHFAHGPTELQKFGCSNEADTANSAMVPSKPVPNSAKDVSPSDTAMRACSTPQMLREKCLLKWQGPEKISRVYADWIDDLPLLRSSPSQVEH